MDGVLPYEACVVCLDARHIAVILLQCVAEQRAREFVEDTATVATLKMTASIAPRSIKFETIVEWSNVSGSATRSRPPLGAFDDAHRVTHSSCRSVCSCTCTAARGVHVGMV